MLAVLFSLVCMLSFLALLQGTAGPCLRLYVLPVCSWTNVCSAVTAVLQMSASLQPADIQLVASQT
jgi:hypothetical protein